MRRKTVRKLIRKLRDHVRFGVPHDLTFKPTHGMKPDVVEALQTALNHSFDIWRQTWLFPWLDMLEKATGCDKLKS